MIPSVLGRWSSHWKGSLRSPGWQCQPGSADRYPQTLGSAVSREIPLEFALAETWTCSLSSSICLGAGKLRRMFVFSMDRHKGKENCSFCGASVHLFPVAVGIGKLRDALGLARPRFLLICVSWLPQLLVGT